MFKKAIYFFAITILSFNCKSDLPEIDYPADLKVDILVANDNSGLVNITAQALNTSEYMFIPYSDDNSAVTNSSGTFQHTFTKEGNHNIEIRAYGKENKYIKQNYQIEIILINDVDISQGYTTPMSYPEYNLIWNDEFNETIINAENWNFEIGTGNSGWGNNELQYYRKENASQQGGVLIIEAKEEAYQGAQYTSARMTTNDKVEFQFGRIDIRALLPQGQGLWPALWMLGQNFYTIGWPACGEIDIMEMVGGDAKENTVHGSLHWDDNGHVSETGAYTLPSNTFAHSYHVFSLIWTPVSIKWLVDDVKYYEKDITSADMTEFQLEHFFIFNVAVGGNWPGAPDETTIFPQKMKVDYVRVFQLK